METKKILLIGGSGFVGGWIANRLSESGYRVTIPTRHRDHSKQVLLLPTVYAVEADVNDPKVLASLVQGKDAVINLVGILHDGDSSKPYGKRFAAAHVELPKNIVVAMRQHGVRRLVQMSALKASADAPSAYLRSKAAGEAVVRAAMNELDVTIFRPSVVFGPDDAFLNTFATLLKFFPVLALGGADARFQRRPRARHAHPGGPAGPGAGTAGLQPAADPGGGRLPDPVADALDDAHGGCGFWV